MIYWRSQTYTTNNIAKSFYALPLGSFYADATHKGIARLLVVNERKTFSAGAKWVSEELGGVLYGEKEQAHRRDERLSDEMETFVTWWALTQANF